MNMGNMTIWVVMRVTMKIVKVPVMTVMKMDDGCHC